MYEVWVEPGRKEDDVGRARRSATMSPARGTVWAAERNVSGALGARGAKRPGVKGGA